MFLIKALISGSGLMNPRMNPPRGPGMGPMGPGYGTSMRGPPPNSNMGPNGPGGPGMSPMNIPGQRPQWQPNSTTVSITDWFYFFGLTFIPKKNKSNWPLSFNMNHKLIEI